MKAISVLTADTTASIIANGGSGNWSAKLETVNQYQYLVCLRHGDKPSSPSDAKHNAPFLVGRISRVMKTEELDKRGDPRLFIEIESYALLHGSEPADRKGTNPVWFAD